MASQRSVGSSDTPSVLAVVIDVNPVEWAARSDEELPRLLEHLLTFANAFWMLSSANQLLVVGAHPVGARVLWPQEGRSAAGAAPPHLLRRALAHGIDELLALDPLPARGQAESSRSLLSPALSLATLRIHRVRREQPLVQPRVLLVHASAEDPSEHLRLVDLGFANQKLDVLIDTILLEPQPPSLTLQQLSHLTGGIHLHATASDRAALSVYLISAVLPDQYSRRFLQPPPQGKLETRGLCTLTRKHVDIGWTCSVCLAVFSTHTLRACAVCGTRFPLPKPPPGAKALLKRKAPADKGDAPTAATSASNPPGARKPLPAPPNRKPLPAPPNRGSRPAAAT